MSAFFHRHFLAGVLFAFLLAWLLPVEVKRSARVEEPAERLNHLAVELVELARDEIVERVHAPVESAAEPTAPAQRAEPEVAPAPYEQVDQEPSRSEGSFASADRSEDGADRLPSLILACSDEDLAALVRRHDCLVALFDERANEFVGRVRPGSSRIEPLGDLDGYSGRAIVLEPAPGWVRSAVARSGVESVRALLLLSHPLALSLERNQRAACEARDLEPSEVYATRLRIWPNLDSPWCVTEVIQ